MSTAEKRHYTVEEYLEFERNSELKHEFYQGEIFAMTGASGAHNLIAGNLFANLKVNLRGRCQVFMSDMRVKVDATGLYTYPDVAVACPKAEFEGKARDTLVNPKLIVEVLSESTEKYDREEKFDHYQQIPSLQEYVLVSQDKHRVEVFFREDDGQWKYSYAKGADASLHFRSVDHQVTFEELYFEVEIPPTLRAGNE